MPSPMAIDIAAAINRRFRLSEREPDAERRLADIVDARVAELMMAVDGYVPSEPMAPEPVIPQAVPINAGHRVAIAGGAVHQQPCGCRAGRGHSQEQTE